MRIETSPDDFHGMAVAQGILTARGGATSHAAVVARQIGKPCVAGCAELVVDYARQAARTATITGTDVRGGRLDQPRRLDRRALPRRAADRRGPLRGPARAPADPRLGRRDPPAWASGPTPTSPRRPPRPARYGAQGIGLCRTEHMFREGERLEIVRGAILVANAGDPRQGQGARPARRSTADEQAAVATFDAAMAKLEVLQQGDFEGIFRRWTALPVVDPADRPAAPRVPAEPRGAAGQGDPRRGAWRRRPNEDKELLGDDQVAARAEPDAGPARLPPRPDDPGLREDPDARDPQRRRSRSRKAGGNPIAKIMIPLVGHVNELLGDARAARGRGRRPSEAAGGVEVDYKFGTMIEVPRGALTADEIADARRLLQLRHQRPDPDDVRLQPRRRRGRLPAQVRRGRDPARSTRSRRSTTRWPG